MVPAELSTCGRQAAKGHSVEGQQASEAWRGGVQFYGSIAPSEPRQRAKREGQAQGLYM